MGARSKPLLSSGRRRAALGRGRESAPAPLRGPVAHLRRALGLLLLASAAVAQERPLELWHDLPGGQGVVLDEQRAPIRGASIRLAARDRHPSRHAMLRAILARHPLPSARSNDDGSFFLPLTPEQRLLGDEVANLFALVVEHPGYAPWIEPLPGGLRAWLGSRVVLRRPDPRDRVTVQIPDPLPGMRLLITNSIEPLLAQEHVVPADGRLELHLPLVPDPLIADNDLQPVTVSAQLLHPTAATKEYPIVPAAEPIALDVPRAAVSTRYAFVRSDAREVTGLRGLYRAQDRRLRWFGLSGSEAPENVFCRLVAVVADGCAATDRLQEGMLHPLPGGGRAPRLQITDADGTPIPRAQIELYTADAWDGVLGEGRIDTRPFTRRRCGADGNCELPSPLPDEPVYLLARAAGFGPLAVLDPRRVGEEPLRLQALRAVDVEVEFVEPGGAPIAGAMLLLDRGAPAQIDTSDARGRLRMQAIPNERYSAIAVAPGFCNQPVPWVYAPDRHERLHIELQHAAPVRMQARSAADEAVAFLPIQWQVRPMPGQPHRVLRSHADSLGRVHLPTAPQSEQGMLHVLGAQSMVECVAGDPPATLRAPESRVVLLDPGETSSWSQSAYRMANGSGSTNLGQEREFRYLLVRWLFVGKDMLVWPVAGQPIRIDDEAVRPGGGTARLTLPRSQRRTPLQVLAADGTRLLEFECLPLVPPQLKIDGHTMVERAGDATYFVARDTRAWDVRILHPDHVQLRLQIPEAGEQQTIEARLEQGSRVELKLPPIPAKEATWSLRFWPAAGAGEVLQLQIGRRFDDPPAQAVLLSPAALPQGSYRMALTGSGLQRPVQKTFDCDGKTPVQLDLTKD